MSLPPGRFTPTSLRLAALAALFTLSVCLISWPGFMSFDSMYALRQARTGIETGGYPPMVSYLWWLCERIIPGQGGMFILGNVLALSGVAALGRALGARELRIFLAMLLLACAPLTLGPMLVVWKDVAFGGLMAIAYAITLKAIDGKRPGVIAAAVLSLAFASTFRLNGVAAALPALGALAWTTCGQPPSVADSIASRIDRKRLVRSLVVFVGLVVATVAFVAMTVVWRLPDLKRIGVPTGSVGVQLHDLLGISICAERNLLPPGVHSGEMTLQRLRQIYRPSTLSVRSDRRLCWTRRWSRPMGRRSQHRRSQQGLRIHGATSSTARASSSMESAPMPARFFTSCNRACFPARR